MTEDSDVDDVKRKLADVPREVLVKLVEDAVATRDRLSVPEIPTQSAVQLKNAYASFEMQHTFSPGQLIKWKPYQRTTRRPEYDEPVIVVQVLSEPYYDDSEDAGSPWFRQPLNLVIGLIDSVGDFLLYHVDGRRFEPYDSPRAAAK
jgi:hypothetical protein